MGMAIGHGGSSSAEVPSSKVTLVNVKLRKKITITFSYGLCDFFCLSLRHGVYFDISIGIYKSEAKRS